MNETNKLIDEFERWFRFYLEPFSWQIMVPVETDPRHNNGSMVVVFLCQLSITKKRDDCFWVMQEVRDFPVRLLHINKDNLKTFAYSQAWDVNNVMLERLSCEAPK